MSKRISFDATIKVRDTCLCLHAQRAARALARRFDDALRPLGLTNGQLSLLMALNRPDPPAMQPVAQLLAMDRTTLTAAVKPLQRKGFICVMVDPADRRTRLLRLTDQGHDLLAQALPVWQETHVAVEAALQGIPADDLRTGLAALAV